MLSGHVPECRSSGIGPRQQVVDIAVEMAVDDLGDDVRQIGQGFDTAELASLDQRGDDGPVLAAAIGAGKERILAIQRNLAVILPISGRMSSSTIAGIRCTGGACVVFRPSGAHRLSWCMWN